MSLPVLVAFAGVLVAAVATGILAGRCVRAPHVCYLAWTVGTLGLLVALAAQAIGLANGFGPSTFRAIQLGAQLVAPLWLAWGLVELVARSEAARFGARLITVALTVVAGVVLATDTLAAQPFSTAWPSASVHYQSVSHLALNVVHVVVLLAGGGAVAVAASRVRTEPSWRAALPGVVPAGLAMLATVALRFPLPGRSAYPLLSTLAAGLIWVGVSRNLEAVTGQGRLRSRRSIGGQVDGSRMGSRGSPGRRDGGRRDDARRDGGQRDGGQRDGARPDGARPDGGPAAHGRGRYGPEGGYRPEEGYGYGPAAFGPAQDYPRQAYPRPDHARAPQRYGGQHAAPDPYGQVPDPYAAPDPYGPPAPYGAPDPYGRYGPPPGRAGGGGIRPGEWVGPGGVPGFTGQGPAHGAPSAPGPASGLGAASGAAAGPGPAGPAGPAVAIGPEAEFVADTMITGTPASASATRPYGRILIFTLLDDKATDFDRLAEQSAEEVRTSEPDTLVYVIHLVPNAPMQRIFYEIYRDRAAFDSHENKSYMKRFVAERRAYVLATNVIELRVKYAKVAPLPTEPRALSAAPPARAQLPPGQGFAPARLAGAPATAPAGASGALAAPPPAPVGGQWPQPSTGPRHGRA
jgi:quinol monooxygenase YgiN